MAYAIYNMVFRRNDPWYYAKVITDDETGVQYILNRRGGITPRLDKDGNIVAVNESETSGGK